MRSRRIAGPFVVAMALAAAGPASAQLRPNMPPVETPSIREDPNASGYRAAESFRRWSEAQGQPTILVFWNREFSDETTTRNRLRLTDDTLVRAAPGVLSTQRDVVLEDERTTGGERHSLSIATSAEIESGFLNAFLGAGGRMMDRNALIRRTSVGAAASDRPDQQFLEALAVEQGVQYLVELLADHDASSPTGFTFRVKVTHLPASRVVARFVTSAAPPEGRRRLVAAPGGFQREAPSTASPEAIGAQLAVETMGGLI